MSWKVRSVWTWVSTRILMVPPSFPSENPSWNPLSMLCWWILPMLIFFTWHVESVFGCDKLYWDRTKHLRAVDSPSLFLPTSFLFFSSVLLVIWCFSKKRGETRELDPTRNQFPPSFSIVFPKKYWLIRAIRAASPWNPGSRWPRSWRLGPDWNPWFFHGKIMGQRQKCTEGAMGLMAGRIIEL